MKKKNHYSIENNGVVVIFSHTHTTISKAKKFIDVISLTHSRLVRTQKTEIINNKNVVNISLILISKRIRKLLLIQTVVLACDRIRFLSHLIDDNIRILK